MKTPLTAVDPECILRFICIERQWRTFDAAFDGPHECVLAINSGSESQNESTAGNFSEDAVFDLVSLQNT